MQLKGACTDAANASGCTTTGRPSDRTIVGSAWHAWQVSFVGESVCAYSDGAVSQPLTRTQRNPARRSRTLKDRGRYDFFFRLCM